MTDRLMDKVALITGGASGIGLATAQLFASEGARVMVADLTSLPADTGDFGFVHTDVRSSQSVQAMVNATVERFGRIDILVNAAGISSNSFPIHELPEELFDQVVSVNLKGVFLCMKYVIPVMLKKRRGAIINVSSVAGMRGIVGGSEYSASKAGVLGLTRCAAKEYARLRIRVNSVCPGWIDTPLVDQLLERNGEKFRDMMMAQIPANRVGKPLEVAQAILYLAADGTYTTGAEFVVDGGVVA